MTPRFRALGPLKGGQAQRLVAQLRFSARAGLLTLGFGAGQLLADPPAASNNGTTPPPAPPAAEASAPLEPPAPYFLTDETTLFVGVTQMVPFKMRADFPAELAPAAIVTPPDLVEVLPAPKASQGAAVGFLRLRPLRTGSAVLEMGNARMTLHLVEDPRGARAASMAPLISAPLNGAQVSGEFAVGVEINAVSDPRLVGRVYLRLPRGKVLEPELDCAVPQTGATRFYYFKVRAEDYGPGVLRIIPVHQMASGLELTGEPLSLAVAPNGATLVQGACADVVHGPRPERVGEKTPIVKPDSAALSGYCVDNHSADPAWVLPVEIREAGDYQLILRARADFGGGALPSIAVHIDEGDRPITGGRLVTTGYQRLPIGKPFRLEEGNHLITARYRNDFGNPKEGDRNLFLDRFELARWGRKAGSGGSAAGPGGDMAGGAMMMEGGSAAPPAAGGGDMMSASVKPITKGIGADDMNASKDEMMMGDMAPGGAASSLAISFRPLITPGTKITGQVVIDGIAAVHAPKKVVPRVGLWLNGQEYDVQNGNLQTFRISRSAFKPGMNKLQLRGTLPGGVKAESGTLTLFNPPEPSATGSPRKNLRFTVSDASWNAALAKQLEDQDDKPNNAAAFYSNGEATLTLPPSLQGKFRVSLEGKGTEARGWPVMEVTLQGKPDEPAVPLGKTEMKNEGSFPVGTVELPPGSKTLTVKFGNDFYEKEVGDRNIWLRALRLEQVADQEDNVPPKIALLYPFPAAGNGSVEVGRADALVADISDNDAVASADLIVDNNPQHMDLRPANGLGPMIFPLLTRGLPPGKHYAKIAAKDRAGNLTESAAVNFMVAADPEQFVGPYQRAVFLLNRLGYGPEPRELAALLTMGEKAWLQDRLWMTAASEEEAEGNLAAFRRARYNEAPRNNGDVASRSLQMLQAEPNPVRARFTVWAENHFSTWIQKEGAQSKWEEHLHFTTMGIAPFRDLLLTSATSPAMIFFLDQQRSYAKKLNENYAREIMELHTLGVHGGYTQSDVTTLAGLLTGWTATEEADLDGVSYDPERVFRFDPQLNVGKECDFLKLQWSKTEPEDRLERIRQVMEILAAHPNTAKFVAQKLVRHYVSNPEPPKLVEDLTQVYMRTGGDLREVLFAMAQHPDFWAARNQPRVTSPQEFALRLTRVSGTDNAQAINAFLSRSGMALFDRATPDGWPEGDGYYTSSNALIQRWRLAKEMQGQLVKMVPQNWAASEDNLKAEGLGRLLDYLAVRLTGSTLPDATFQSASDLLATAGPDAGLRSRLAATVVAQMPEASLR